MREDIKKNAAVHALHGSARNLHAPAAAAAAAATAAAAAANYRKNGNNNIC